MVVTKAIKVWIAKQVQILTCKCKLTFGVILASLFEA